MNTEYTTTSTTTPPALTVAVAIDTKTTALLAVALFVAMLGALLIYKSV